MPQQLPDRQSTRIPGYDYSQPGYYSVTICTLNRKKLFGEIIDSEMHLNRIGEVVHSIWKTLPERFSNVELDQSIIMPNHLHGIIILNEPQPLPYESVAASTIPERFKPHIYAQRAARCPPTLGQVVRTFKGAVTHRLHEAGRLNFAWQPRYFPVIIRGETHLLNARRYIINNPANWAKDTFYVP